MKNPGSEPGSAFSPGDEDSARAVLLWLESDRGKILTEREYQEMRETVLRELAEGPRLGLSTRITFGVVGLLFFSMFLVGLHVGLGQDPAEWMLAVASFACLLLWGGTLWKFVTSIRSQAQLSIEERLGEVHELREAQLISQTEFETLFAAIHMTRGATPPRA